jgi:hypothetical protein
MREGGGYRHDECLEDFASDVDDETKKDCHVEDTAFGSIHDPIEE